MNNQDFNHLIDIVNERTKEILTKKASEYAIDSTQDRLTQFHRAGSAQDINPAQALLGMMTKHYTSVSDMAKNPTGFTYSLWMEKLTDLHNYLYLLEGLICDLGVSDDLG